MSDRIRKINELVREEAAKAIADSLGREIFVTVTAVETTDDLKHSTIWISVMGDEEKAVERLNEERREIQKEVTSKMATRNTPKIEFKIDHSQNYVENIERLLKDEKRK